MDDIAAMTHQLEYLFLKKVIAVLEDETMELADAKAAAIAFLAMEPFPTAEDAYIKIMEFVRQHEMFIELKDYMNAYQIEKNDRARIALIREHMKRNNIDKALEVAKA